MELQWPLILFTTFLAWSAGLFGTLGLLALVGKGKGFSAQLPALVIAFVLMVIGGIAVFFHLQHWERVFNGFGHLTSGITQELIGMVVVVIVMVIYLASLRRRNDDTVPVWCGLLALVVSVALVIVMGDSYMMVSRPAWNSVSQILSILGASCIMGPATLAIIMEVRHDDTSVIALPAVIGSLLNAVATVAYLLIMDTASSAFTSLGYYYDPTQITRGMIDFTAATGVFNGGRLVLAILVIICVLGAAVLALVGKRLTRSRRDVPSNSASPEDSVAPEGSTTIEGGLSSKTLTDHWKALGTLIVVVSFLGAVVLRVIFYELGLSVFMFY